MKKRLTLLAGMIAVLTAVSGAALTGCSAGAKNVNTATEALSGRARGISFEEYQKLSSDGEDFFILIARPSCKFCAIVDDYILMDLPDPGKPVYYLSLEPYRFTDEYEEIKSVLDIDFVPTFQYYEGGHMKYNLNCPLEDEYLTSKDNAVLTARHKEMEEKIQSFINGATGKGPVISEEVKRPEETNVIDAQPIS